jgi:thymidylate kinase
LEYHKRVRNGYLDLSKQYPARIKVIKVDADVEEIFKRVKLYIDALLGLMINSAQINACCDAAF